MRGRDRLVATAAIWIALALVMNTILERFTRLNAVFTGLWPNFPPGSLSDETYLSAQEFVSQNANNMIRQVTDGLNAQLAANMPVLVILSLALIIAATLSTYFVWSKAHLEPEVQPAPKQAIKVKHGSRVERVVNALDEDELDELRARLWEADSADAVSLEELLAERGRGRR